jgi:hypothetical protein
MRISIFRTVLLAGACLLSSIAVMAQNAQRADHKIGALDATFTFNAAMGRTVPNQTFWMEGGSVQIHYQFLKGLGVVGDLALLRTSNMANSGVGLNLVTATFGPRYTFALPKQKAALFVQALGGRVYGSNSVFPELGGTSASASGLAVNAGGGINIPINRRIGFRAIEADFLRTSLPSSTSNVEHDLRLGSGLIVRF